MNPIIMQALAYFVVFVISFVIMSVLMKGFFLKFLAVKSSMGQKVLVKVREVNRDFYAVGEIIEGELKYKSGKDKKTLTIPDDVPVFYRSLGVSMIDVDSKTNAICTVSYDGVTGFDAIKHEQLMVRCLEKPTITDNKEMLMFILLIAIVIGVIFIGYNMFKMSSEINVIHGLVKNLNTGFITATGKI